MQSTIRFHRLLEYLDKIKTDYQLSRAWLSAIRTKLPDGTVAGCQPQQQQLFIDSKDSLLFSNGQLAFVNLKSTTFPDIELDIRDSCWQVVD
jgi:hypothetical protein